MKSFITPECSSTGKVVFRIQWEDVDASGLSHLTQGTKLIALAMPRGQSAEAVWQLRILFDDSRTLELSSASSCYVDWQEVGSLNVRLIDHSDDITGRGVMWDIVDVRSFDVQRIQRLVFEDGAVISECGLVLVGSNGEILISVGVPTGSVTVSAPLLTGRFVPEYPVESCKREALIE